MSQPLALQRTSPRITPRAILNSSLRVLLWMLLIAGSMVLIPWAMMTYEEYGLELPAWTLLIIAIFDWARRFWIATLPMALMTPFAIELGLIAIPRGRWRQRLNAFAWTFFLVVFFVVGGAFAIPLAQLWHGLM